MKSITSMRLILRAMLIGLAAFAMTCLSGCMTPYQSYDGFLGGYSETQTAPNQYTVYFSGNGYTTSDNVIEMARLRAAELTLERGYTHFIILNGNTDTTVNDGQGVNGSDISKSITSLRIKLLMAPESGALDARAIVNRLGPKYEHIVGGDASSEVQASRAAAERGDAKAQDTLGDFYQKGHGVPQDYTQAAEWYRKSAEQGYADAQVSLGLFYEKGMGVPQDYVQAMQWYRKAADQGNSTGQYNLANLYTLGHGVPQDYSQAAQWYRKAAEQGDGDAQYVLGAFYDYGKGVPQDHAQAMAWYRKAAKQGVAAAQQALDAQ